VDQVALPYRIALVALLLVAALWFVALRPKGGTDTTTPTANAPGVTGLANDVDKAQTAAGTNTTPTTSTNTTGTTSTGAPSTPTTPAATPQSDLLTGVGANDPSRPLLEAVDKGRVAVMLFWNSNGTDDRAVRRAVLDVNRRGGKVLTRVIPISRVGRYEAITRGASIQGSPTVVVINRDGIARTIAGFTTTPEISQIVSDLGGKGF
jgi:hypothetical protein